MSTVAAQLLPPAAMVVPLPVRESPLVLVIDPHAEELELAAAMLRAGGYSSCCCSSVTEALAAARREPPRLILADVSLGGADAPRLCEQIKHDADLIDVPVMYLSSGQIPDIIRRSHDGGCAYHVRKPFDARVVLELIGKALAAPRQVTHS